jgi:hypothetical protein
MAQNQIAARGTKVYLFRMFTTDNIEPEDITFTTATAIADKGAESITIAASGNLQTYKASEANPIFLNFIDEDGIETLTTVIADIEPGDTALTCLPLPKAIAVGATADLILEAKARENASLQPQNKQVEVETLDGDGWKFEQNTQWGYMLQCNGYYSPLDPSFNTLRTASGPDGKNLWVKVQLPNPDSGTYSAGEYYTGFFNVRSTPIETGAASELIKSNFEMMSQGPVVLSPATPIEDDPTP